MTNVTMQVSVEVIMDDDSSASDSDGGQRDKHSAALLWSHTSCVGGNNPGGGGGGDDRDPWINSSSQPLSAFEHWGMELVAPHLVATKGREVLGKIRSKLRDTPPPNPHPTPILCRSSRILQKGRGG